MLPGKPRLAMFLIVLLAFSPASITAAQEVPLIEVTCPLTGPGVGVCAGVAILLHEMVKAANGEKAFGPNGEVMKLLKAPISIAAGNVKGAKRESGEAAKGVRILTGISIEDIEKRGLLGGENSEARKICNAIANIGGGKC